MAFPLNDEESLGYTLGNVKGDPGQGTQTQKPGRAAGGLLYLRSRTAATAPEATTEMSVNKRQKMLLTRIATKVWSIALYYGWYSGNPLVVSARGAPTTKIIGRDGFIGLSRLALGTDRRRRRVS